MVHFCRFNSVYLRLTKADNEMFKDRQKFTLKKIPIFLFRVTVGSMIPKVKKFTTCGFSLANSLDSKTDSSLLKCKHLKKEHVCVYRHIV